MTSDRPVDLRSLPCSRGFLLREGFAPLTVGLLLLLGQTAVEGAVSISVSPIRIEVSVPPGETRTDVVTVENRSDEPVRLRVTVADWHLADDGTPVFVKRGKAPEFSMSDWIEVNPTELALPPLGSAPLRYTITSPAGTPAGGYRTSILIESVPETLPRGQAAIAYLNARIGIILYNRIGAVTPDIEIAAQDLVPDPDAPDRLMLRVKIRNAGRVHARVSGDTRIVDGSGRDMELAPIRDAVVLPESERYLFVRFARSLPRDEFRIVSRLDVGLPELLEAETRVAAPPGR